MTIALSKVMRRIAFLALYLAAIITSLMLGILIRMLRVGTQALHERPRLRYASLAAGVALTAIAFLRDR